MTYKVTFSLIDVNPRVEVEAKDRDEAIKLYHDPWKQGKLTPESSIKYPRYFFLFYDFLAFSRSKATIAQEGR
jgi:hypothetical protein